MPTKITGEGEHHNFSSFSRGRGPSTTTHGKNGWGKCLHKKQRNEAI